MFPFTAVTGMKAAQDALLWLAVDPGLKGVLIEAGPGTAKSLLARSLPALLPARGAPFVEAPCSVTEDQLLGGLDLELIFARWGRRFRLPRPSARGQAEPPAPPSSLPHTGGLLARAEGGFLCIDQVNLLTCAIHIAAALDNFALIGTYDRREGTVNAALAEAVAIHVTENWSWSAADRVEMLRRVEAFHREPAAFRAQYPAEPLRERVAAARELLPHVEIAPGDRRKLSETAAQLGVASHRADIFAVRLARVRAALAFRRHVEEEDLAAAVRFVLEPRADPGLPLGQPGRPAPQREMSPTATARGGPETCPRSAEDRIVPATDCALSEDLDANGNSRQAGGRRNSVAAGAAWVRGRAVRAVRKRPGARKVALVPTLLAAAARGRRRPRKEDLRFRKFRQRAGVLAIFVVDASGSMALSRMNEAKGAVLNLLQKAYVHRDRVALISFRGERAEVLLRPSRSVELAKRALDALPAGGGTPLAAGLHAALELATERQADARRVLLVLMTDGRANVETEPITLEAVCAAVRAEGIASVVIDNRDRSVAGGETERLARLLGGRQIYLPRTRAGSISDAVAELTEAMRT